MKAKVKLLEGVSFAGEADSGHTVIMDGPPDQGGQNRGARPMEMLLLGMGGCAAFDVVHILRRSRLEVHICEAELEAQRAEKEPKVFTEIKMHFKVGGVGLKDAVVKRAVQLSAEKYCSASIMLGKTARIVHSYEIIDGDDT